MHHMEPASNENRLQMNRNDHRTSGTHDHFGNQFRFTATCASGVLTQHSFGWAHFVKAIKEIKEIKKSFYLFVNETE